MLSSVSGRASPASPGSPVIAFAGLLAHWQAPDGAAVLSCALLTRAAAPAIADIHDRMPLVLSPADYEAWLAAEQRPEVLTRLLAGAREDFQGYPVSTRVNDPRNDFPELLEDLS